MYRRVSVQTNLVRDCPRGVVVMGLREAAARSGPPAWLVVTVGIASPFLKIGVGEFDISHAWQHGVLPVWPIR
jgi:hypothetical protein